MRTIFIGLFFSIALSVSVVAQEPWTYTTTGVSHTIFLAAENVPLSDGAPVIDGDYIGVFYRTNDNQYLNAGYTRWEGESTYITAYGEDGISPGFSTGDSIYYRIWKAKTGCAMPVTTASYLSGGIYTSAGKFEPNGISGLELLEGTTPAVYYTESDICIQSEELKPVLDFDPAIEISFHSEDTGIKIDPETGLVDIKNSQPGNYSIRFITDICLKASSFELRIHALPEIPLPDTLAGCGSLVLDAGMPGVFLWSTGESSRAIEVKESGYYTLSVQNPFGCMASKAVKVTVSPNIKADGLTYDVQYKACHKQARVIINLNTITGGIPPYTCTVISPAGQQYLSEKGAIEEFRLPDGVYDLLITDSIGCQVLLKDLMVIRNTEQCFHKVISPNEDGLAESLYIPEQGIARIYDRFGNVKNQLQVPASWNGKDAQGQFLPTGNYMVVINQEKTYSITIVR